MRVGRAIGLESSRHGTKSNQNVQCLSEIWLSCSGRDIGWWPNSSSVLTIKGSAGLIMTGASDCFGSRDVVTDCCTVGIALSKTIVSNLIFGVFRLIAAMTTSLTWPCDFASHHSAFRLLASYMILAPRFR